MILPENIDLRVFVFESPAIQKEGEFGSKCGSDCDNRGVVEGVCLAIVSIYKVLDGKCDKDEGYGRHQKAEYDVTNGFETCFSGWEAVGVNALDGPVCKDESNVGHGIEDGTYTKSVFGGIYAMRVMEGCRKCKFLLGHCSKEREGPRRNSTIKLESCQDDIGSKRAVYSNLELEMVVSSFLSSFFHMVLDRLQHAFYLLILVLVELLYFLCLGSILIELYGPAAIPLP